MLDVVHGRGHGALGNGDKAFLHFFGCDAGKLQITLTTGMSILGKMSVAMRAIVTMPMSTIRMAATVRV
jgi:hypothetical protein